MKIGASASVTVAGISVMLCRCRRKTEMRSQPGILLLILLAIALAACQGITTTDRTAATLGEDVQGTAQPTPSPETSVTAATAQVEEPVPVEMTEIVSVTEFFRVQVPTGWQAEEMVPGASIILANAEPALERYNAGSAIESGDIVLNVGFLPLALLQEDQLAHYGFAFDASPEVFLQSLLPMFRVGEDPAGTVVGTPVLTSIGDGRNAGMITLSIEGREGLVLVFDAGNGAIAFVSAVAHPTEMDAQMVTIQEIAASVAFTGTQDALYGALYGG